MTDTNTVHGGAVAWRAEKERQTYLYDRDEEYRMHSARDLGFRITPLYLYPTPQTDTDAREKVVEALARIVRNHGGHIEALPGATGMSDLQFARDALAALKTGDA